MAVAAVVLAATAVVSAGLQIQSARAQKKASARIADAQRRQAEAQAEANNISTAQAQNQQAAERRRAAREERIRRAQIVQGSENAGVGGSSGALGAQGVVGTNLGDVIAQSRAGSAAATGIAEQQQKSISAGQDIINAQASLASRQAQLSIFSAINTAIGQTAGAFSGGGFSQAAGASSNIFQQSATGATIQQNRNAGTSGLQTFGLR